MAQTLSKHAVSLIFWNIEMCSQFGHKQASCPHTGVLHAISAHGVGVGLGKHMDDHHSNVMNKNLMPIITTKQETLMLAQPLRIST